MWYPPNPNCQNIQWRKYWHFIRILHFLRRSTLFSLMLSAFHMFRIYLNLLKVTSSTKVHTNNLWNWMTLSLQTAGLEASFGNLLKSSRLARLCLPRTVWLFTFPPSLPCDPWSARPCDLLWQMNVSGVCHRPTLEQKHPLWFYHV